MESTEFNQAQMQLLEMMSFVRTPESLADLNKVISDYFAQQAQEEINRLWATGELNKSFMGDWRIER